MATWTFEAAQPGYAKLWDSISIKGGADTTNCNYFIKKIIAGEKQYREVEEATGWPWFFVGALHMREAACNFKCVLHNGERIVGTNRKTKLVPAGRGPFKTWALAAIDAIGDKAHFVGGKKWSPALMAWMAELFNGLGYHLRGILSPYDWAGSNHEQHGKYIRDHVWDGEFDDPQLGVMTVIKALCEVLPDVADAMAEHHVSPMPTKTKVKIALGTAGGVTTAAAGANEAVNNSSSYLDSLQPIISIFQNHGTTIGMVFTIAIVVGCVGWHFYEKATASAEASA